MHQAGVRALTGLLQFAEPSADRRNMACACGHRAHYLELRSKSVLTAVGEARVSRPYYLCSHCSAGQFPVDVELDIQHTGLSPGVRRMLATVGSAAPFEDGRQQMQLLAGLEVTTKAVERTTEAVGAEWIWNLAADHFPGAVQIVDTGLISSRRISSSKRFIRWKFRRSTAMPSHYLRFLAGRFFGSPGTCRSSRFMASAMVYWAGVCASACIFLTNWIDESVNLVRWL